MPTFQTKGMSQLYCKSITQVSKMITFIFLRTGPILGSLNLVDGGKMSASQQHGSSAAAAPLGFDVPAGVAALVLLNCAAYAAAVVFQSPAAASLMINPSDVKWWSFATSAFVHHNLEQLGCNMFVVFFFSQMVYRDLGAVGVWFAYLLAGIGQ